MPEQIGSFIIEPKSEPSDSEIRTDAGNSDSQDGTGESESRSQEPERVNGFPTVDPTSFGEWSTGSSSTGSSAGIRRRGRPPGSKNKPREEGDSSSLTDVKDLLMGCHAMLALWTKTPELKLDPSEAKEFADAIKDVSKFYTNRIDPKTLAWGNLIFVAGGIYGSRFVAINSNREKKPKLVTQPTSIKRPTVAEVHAQETLKPLTNPSQMWPQGGGTEGDISEG